MKAKRFLSGLLAAALLLCAAPAAYAAQKPTVKLSSGTAEPGGTVTLTVSIENNPGLSACLLYLYCDTNLFSVDIRRGIRATDEFQYSGGLMNNTIKTAIKNGRYDGAPNKDGLISMWYNSSGVNTYEDGNILSVTFSVDKEIPVGTYEIELGYSSRDTVNQAGENVFLNTISGEISVGVGEDAAQEPSVPATPSSPTTPIEPEPEPEQPLFTDISGHWAESYIERAAEIGLVNGMGNNKFEPNGIMTRAQMVTLLWRVLGEPKASTPASFTDLEQDWYKQAIAWAEENQVVNGVGGGKFDPDGTVTREQVVTVLHRLIGKPVGMEMMFASTYDSYYTDSAAISDWAKAAVYWALYEEIYCGEASVAPGKTLAPNKEATRAQIMVMIVRHLDDR